MSSPKVLIVEDDRLLSKAIGARFQSVNFIVKNADSAESARKILKDWIPSVIVLDLLLPGMDGRLFLKKLKKDPALKSIPVLISSNLSQDSDIQEGYELSAAEYLTKSNISLNELVRLATLHINMSEHGQKSLNQ